MTRPILLALSSFRWAEQEIEQALADCARFGARLHVLFVVDVNLARYFANSGVMAGTSLRDEMEHGLLEDHRRQAREVLERVSALASQRGVECLTDLRVGRFAEEVRAVAGELGPGIVIMTRARRPQWLRRLFGSPVDRLCDDLSGECELRIIE